MKTEIINKLSPQGREAVINIEARLRKLDDDLFELNLMLKEMQDKHRLL